MSQLSTWQIVSCEKKVVNSCENNRQPVTCRHI